VRPDFDIGEQVRLNHQWATSISDPGTRYYEGRKAEVVGYSRYAGVLRVRFDGNKSINLFHESFFDGCGVGKDRFRYTMEDIYGERYSQ
jgi:hypothetical protein